jgi:hypothetical protein
MLHITFAFSRPLPVFLWELPSISSLGYLLSPISLFAIRMSFSYYKILLFNSFDRDWRLLWLTYRRFFYQYISLHLCGLLAVYHPFSYSLCFLIIQFSRSSISVVPINLCVKRRNHSSCSLIKFRCSDNHKFLKATKNPIQTSLLFAFIIASNELFSISNQSTSLWHNHHYFSLEWIQYMIFYSSPISFHCPC